MKHKFLILAALCLAVLSTGCKKNNDNEPSDNWSDCVFTINEGPFQSGTGTITAYNRKSHEVTPEIFRTANGRPLGNIVQSMTIFGDKAAVVVNNANKVEFVNLDDFKSIAEIEDIPLPRYFVSYNNSKAYVSCWDNSVKVITLDTYSVTSSIQAGTGPDKMILQGDYLFVLNSGGYDIDSTVTVIRTSNDAVAASIVAGPHPAGICADGEGNVWILCGGKGWNGFPDPSDLPGKLVKIDPATLEITKEFPFPGSDQHPDNLAVNSSGDTLYYIHPEGIFSFPVHASSLNETPVIPLPGTTMFSSIAYDRTEKMIYASDPLDYAQNGLVYRYHPSAGDPVDSFLVGIAPNGFCFN